MKTRKIPGNGIRTFLEPLEAYLLPEELEYIATAYRFSKYGHKGQTRDDGETRYFQHPKDVVSILFLELSITDWKILAEGFLHDVMEDAYLLSWERLQKNFGKDVARDIKTLTKIKYETHKEYSERLKKGGKRVLLVKLADRLHNSRTLKECDEGKIRRKMEETVKYYIPLAQHLKTILPPKEKWRADYLKEEIQKALSIPA